MDTQPNLVLKDIVCFFTEGHLAGHVGGGLGWLFHSGAAGRLLSRVLSQMEGFSTCVG